MQRIAVQQLSDDAKFNRLHWRVSIWCFAILACDGYDLAVAGTALPSIMKSMGVEASTAGFMASSALFGMLFGAIALGTLADAIGRCRTIAIATVIFSLFTAAAGFAKDPITFSILRFIAGIGIGGAIPNIVAHMTEYSPKSMRSSLVAIVGCGTAFGGILAALLGKQLIETYGWQMVFIAAIFPIVLAPFIVKSLPESMAFLIKKNDNIRLRGIISEMRPDFKFGETATFHLPTESKAKLSLRELFDDGRGLNSVLLWVAFFASLFLLYALSSWLVKLMAMAGYSLGSALTLFFIYNAGAILGTIIGGLLADRFGIKWVALGFFVMGSFSITLLGYGAEPLYLIVGLAGASTLGAQTLLYAYAGQFYPMSIRSTGVGCAAGLGRFGAIIAPISIGFLVSMKLPLAQNFMVIGAVSAIGAIVVLLFRQLPSSSTDFGHQPAPAVVNQESSERA